MEDLKIQKFLKELTDLLIKHHVGITGETILYKLEYDDYARECKLDEESKITFE